MDSSLIWQALAGGGQGAAASGDVFGDVGDVALWGQCGRSCRKTWLSPMDGRGCGAAGGGRAGRPESAYRAAALSRRRSLAK